MAGRVCNRITLPDVPRYVRVLCSASFHDTTADVPEFRVYPGVPNARPLYCDVVHISDYACELYAIRHTGEVS